MPRTAKLVAMRDGRVLLVRKRGGKWGLPGGKADRGEGYRACLWREVTKEELAGVRTLKYRKWKIFHFRDPKTHKRFPVMVYVGRVRGKVRPGKAEIVAARWVTIKNIWRLKKKNRLTTTTPRILKKFLQHGRFQKAGRFYNKKQHRSAAMKTVG